MEQQIDFSKIYQELKTIKESMITKNEMESILETFMILSNSETVKQIENSQEDIILGNTREINSIDDI